MVIDPPPEKVSVPVVVTPVTLAVVAFSVVAVSVVNAPVLGVVLPIGGGDAKVK